MTDRTGGTGIQRAADAAAKASGLNGATALARELNVSNQAVYAWLKRGWAPASRAQQLSIAYGVPARDLLKPSLAAILYPSEASQAASDLI